MITLSIRQPFAGAVASGWKTVENRSQMFTHRGTFLIHAGTRFHAWGERATAEVETVSGHQVPMAGGPGGPTAWQYGAIIGVADLHAAHRGCDGSCSPWAHPGDVHHLIRDARPLRLPVPCPGRLGPFTPAPEVLTRVREVWPR